MISFIGFPIMDASMYDRKNWPVGCKILPHHIY
jgi:hypothetical protein